MLNPNINIIKLLEEEYNLYAKHLVLDEIQLNGQKRLKNSKVLIIGAGGLGCPALLYLAASGIGYIGIIDYDYVDKSNLTRQILYTQENINQYKNISAKIKLKEINPNIKIITHIYKLTYTNAIEIIQYYDIIIDTCDNYETRYIIDKICYKLHKIHLYGAVQNFESQLSSFNYKSGHRYIDIYPNNLNLINRNCSTEGILGVVTGYTGLLQTTEALKIILGLLNFNRNKILINNLLMLKIKKINIYKQPKTYNLNKIKQLNKTFISSNLHYHFNHTNNLIIDIRSQHEFQINHIKSAINIPLTKLKQKKTIDFLINNCKKAVVFIICNTTYRSLVGQYILKQYKITSYIQNAT